jgi:hypothetical protein
LPQTVSTSEDDLFVKIRPISLTPHALVMAVVPNDKEELMTKLILLPVWKACP